jgi:hypothetical protein
MLSHPLVSFKLPISKLFSSMGVAPDRAARFIRLARECSKVGQDYWALRFLANALHYIEDVSSPFHSTQTPTKKFVAMPFFEKHGAGPRKFVHQVRQIISYYHFAFEDYIGRVLDTGFDGVPDAKTLLEALAKGTGESIEYTGDAESLVQAIAIRSLGLSAAAGQTSLRFFSPISTHFLEFEPKSEMNESWWKQTMALPDTPERQNYFRVVREMFVPLGQWVRGFVLFEMKQSDSLLRLLGGREPIEVPAGIKSKKNPKRK